MKKCEYCSKEFTQKRESKKFCSDSCRVMNNRKNGKKLFFSKVQRDVIFNEVMKKINAFTFQPTTPDYYDDSKMDKYTNDEPMFQSKPKIKRSYETYQQLKLDCLTAEEWYELRDEILASSLPQNKKTLLIS